MKNKTIYRCRECGFSSPKWLGRCPECGAWNTMDEELLATSKNLSSIFSSSSSRSRRTLTDFSSRVSLIKDISEGDFKRTATGISEFDRILGGGVVDGSVVLLGGPPGIGKSTLMLQAASELFSKSKNNVLYISGEESAAQIKNRAQRILDKDALSDGIYVLCETNLENIIENIKNTAPKYVVIDSIQTIYREDLSGAPGTVSQVRECAAEILKVAKAGSLSIFILGHVTKEGDLAGPRVLEHIVDTVLYFEAEKQQIYRILRAAKNRFGPTSEIGVFEMTSSGLKEVKNPSSLFLSEHVLTEGKGDIPGSVTTATVEGTRPILVEIQALTSRASGFGAPRRQTNGFDYNRAALLIAVLESRCGLHLETQDIYLNVAGGLRIKETAIDLAAALALAGSFMGFCVPYHTIVIGEVGLAGEVRAVGNLDERLKEAEAMGFREAIIPRNNTLRGFKYKNKIQIKPVSTLKETIEFFKKK